MITYKGVTETTDGRYIARLSERTLGVFDSAIEAAFVWDITVLTTFGEFAPDLNFAGFSDEWITQRDERELVASAGNGLDFLSQRV